MKFLYKIGAIFNKKNAAKNKKNYEDKDKNYKKSLPKNSDEKLEMLLSSEKVKKIFHINNSSYELRVSLGAFPEIIRRKDGSDKYSVTFINWDARVGKVENNLSKVAANNRVISYINSIIQLKKL